jgi:hypothetical protein
MEGTTTMATTPMAMTPRMIPNHHLLRKQGKRDRKKGKQKDGDEEMVTDKEEDMTSQKKRKQPKWVRTESPTRKSTRGKEPIPADPAVRRKPSWAKPEDPSRSSSRLKKAQATEDLESPDEDASPQPATKVVSHPPEKEDVDESPPPAINVANPMSRLGNARAPTADLESPTDPAVHVQKIPAWAKPEDPIRSSQRRNTALKGLLPDAPPLGPPAKKTPSLKKAPATATDQLATEDSPAAPPLDPSAKKAPTETDQLATKNLDLPRLEDKDANLGELLATEDSPTAPPLDPSAKKAPSLKKAPATETEQLATEVLDSPRVEDKEATLAELLETEDLPPIEKEEEDESSLPATNESPPPSTNVDSPMSRIVDLPALVPVASAPGNEDDDPNGSDSNDDPKPLPSKKVTRKRRRKKKNKPKRDEETETEEEEEKEPKKVKKKGKWEQPERSPTRISPRKKTAMKKPPPAAPAEEEDEDQSPPTTPRKESAKKEPPPAAPPEDEDEDQSPPPATKEPTPPTTIVDSPLSRIVNTPALVEVARVSKPEGDDGSKDDSSSAEDTDGSENKNDDGTSTKKRAHSSDKDSSSAEDTDNPEDDEDVTSKKKRAQSAKFRKLTATHQPSPPSNRKKVPLPTHKNGPGKTGVTKRLSRLPQKKSMDDDSILNIPVVQGRMKSQKEVDIFFHQQEALQRQKQNESADRRRNKRARDKMTTEEIKLLAQQAKDKRREDKEEKKKAIDKEIKAKRFAEAAAQRIHKKIYKTFLDTKRKKGKSVDRQHNQNVLKELDGFFPNSQGNVKPHQGSELEIDRLRYHPAVGTHNETFFAEDGRNESKSGRAHIVSRPTVREQFDGIMRDPRNNKDVITREISPRWVHYHFRPIFVNLVMMTPNVWFPVPIGNSRPADEMPPVALLVKKVPIRYQQFDRGQCLLMGVASCLYYCGEKEAAVTLSNEALQFKNLTSDLAIKKLKEAMLKFVPCIGDCTIFNVRNAKKRAIKKLSIEELIATKTRFPTVIIPLKKRLWLKPILELLEGTTHSWLSYVDMPCP